MGDIQTVLKRLAHKHEDFDGQLTWYLLPFENVQLQVVARELNRVMPQYRWENPQTGAVVYVEPAEAEAEQWTAVEQWTATHYTFIRIEAAPVIEFALKSKAPSFLRGFQHYRVHRNGDLAHNFELFTSIVGDEIVRSFWNALEAAGDANERVSEES
jgi:hypothetical protein